MKRRPLILLGVLTILSTLIMPGNLAQGQQQGTIETGQSSGIVVVDTIPNDPCGMLELMIVDSDVPHTEGTVICSGNKDSGRSDLVSREDGVLATMTVRNTSNRTVTMKQLRVGGRGPEGDIKNWGAPNAEWPADTNITLRPGQEYTYERMRYFDGDPGTYFAEPVFQDTNNQWHGISPFPRAWFEIVPDGDAEGAIREIHASNATPWSFDCAKERPGAEFPSVCLPAALTLNDLPPRWQTEVQHAADTWNNLLVGHKWFERSNITDDMRTIRPVFNGRAYGDIRLAPGEVRVVLGSQIPPEAVDDWDKLNGRVGTPAWVVVIVDPGDARRAIAALVVLNDTLTRKWSTDDKVGVYVLDTQTIALHEFGHVLGLRHPDAAERPCKSKVMNPGILEAFAGLLERRVSSDDVACLAQIYPLASQGRETKKTFAETGHTVSGRLLETWYGNRSYEDSLYAMGFPLTAERDEVSPTDGKTYKTQWFERARLEYHPENPAPYDVLLGLLGTDAAKGRQNEVPFRRVPQPRGGTVNQESVLLSEFQALGVSGSITYAVPWFQETGHTLGDESAGGRAIAAYWNKLGGLSQFGFPLSQPFMERNKEDGKTYLVQYFERQRFEYHPENKGGRYEVLLGRLGAEQYANQNFGPVSGQLAHRTRDNVKTAGVQLQDFEVEVRFYNPYGAGQGHWDEVIFFRQNSNNYYNLILDSSKQWTLNLGINQSSKRGFGTIPNWDVSPTGSNLVKLVVKGGTGELMVNGQKNATLNLSDHVAPGDVSILAGFNEGNSKPGAVTRYEGFAVRSVRP
jgi:hypothetical protein